ncbi:2-succinyl-6-hydroxy-2,4-cyclohexadiene-1-carboxylate synthase [Oceanobacillus halophilus]|uniref:Putative 2-succinyl-6-hydroxy-2,4-cyclohexadiene-1-carboxylate synthase n=1 Tax=Oceanobacillus halophilus TaxID=930130 RepID=A0A494ZTM7_9BACI|nr:2-succinyl-6-hydroxy-2,4-cyclohexadiene-1-carboxylate synthase [Oceanobacillus halophilus]RKQ29570.1 2-succinyl-6-hydroxy-2,4-cyclohexadiene-1-carboxylate synthase [Oceanobacillus halophilus]
MYASIGDATYYYEIHGEGEPVVLLHGFTGSTSTWQQYIKSESTRFKIIVIDLPGHGHTKMKTPRTMEQCCKDVNQLLQEMRINSFHLVGYSMGGRTALSFAMLYPEKLRTLILESASPGLYTTEERKVRMEKDEKIARKIETDGILSFVDFWENLPLFETQKELPKEIQVQIREERLAQVEEGLAMSLRYMGTGRQPSWWGDLHQLDMPILLIVGEKDEKFIRINKKMQKLFVSCKLKICGDAGHAIHVEKPEMFDKLVTEFISVN